MTADDLGDISDDVTAEMISTARTQSLLPGCTRGSFPVTMTPPCLPAIDSAAGSATGCTMQPGGPQRLGEHVALTGVGLHSEDGGQTCRATQLPAVTALPGRLLFWAGHYPPLSAQARLRIAGLRYPGDLTNLGQTGRRRTLRRADFRSHLRT